MGQETLAPNEPLRFRRLLGGISRRLFRQENPRAGRHQRFLALVTEVSSALVRAADESWEDELRESLHKLGEFFRADRCCILRLHDRQTRMSNTHEWCAPGVSSQIEALQDVPEMALPWWFAQMRNHRVIRISRVDSLPVEAVLEREELERQEIHSLLYLTMLDHEGTCIGALGFDCTREEPFWDEEDVAMLRLLTDSITTLIQRREDRRRIQQSEEKYRLLVDNSTNGVLALELLCAEDGTAFDFRFLSVNPAFCALLGGTAEDLCGQKASERLPALLSPRCLQAFEEGVWRQKADSFELALEEPAREFQVTVYSLGGPRLAAVFSDITEQKANARKNKDLTAQLLHSQKMESIGRLAGGVAHDFNNALQIIMGNADMALNFQEPKPAVQAALEEIREAARNSSGLTNQLLAFARKQRVEPRVLDLNEAVRKSLKMIRRLLSEDIRLDWTPGGGLDPVYMDPGQLDQILINLCVNSRDALGPAGHIVLSTCRHHLGEEESLSYPESSPGPYARLSITDNGHGMPPEVLAKIFEPFFTTKTLGQGTGLGLATVLGIVMQNHGFIAVDSAVDRGTTFHVHLPFSVLEGGDEEPPAPAVPARAETPETVLLVEDEEMVLQMATLILRKLGYSVIPCASATEALRRLEEMNTPPDVLLTDVIMPDMNGTELAHTLLEKYPDVHVLYMSGYTADVVARHGIVPEGGNFLQKPFTIESLAGKLRDLFPA